MIDPFYVTFWPMFLEHMIAALAVVGVLVLFGSEMKNWIAAIQEGRVGLARAKVQLVEQQVRLEEATAARIHAEMLHAKATFEHNLSDSDRLLSIPRVEDMARSPRL